MISVMIELALKCKNF